MNRRSKLTAADYAAPLSRRDDAGDSGLARPLLKDKRSIRALLKDWMLTEGYAPFNETATFLEHIGLDSAVSPQQWDALLTGDAAPSRILSAHLGAIMQFSKPEEKTNIIPTYYLFTHRAATARTECAEKIGLHHKDYIQFRRQWLERLAARISTNRKKPNETEINTSTPIYARLDAFAKQHYEGDLNALLDTLAHQHKRHPDEVLELVQQLWLEGKDPEIKRWIATELDPRNAVHPGTMLRFLRQCSNKSQKEMGQALDVSDNEVSRWELGMNIDAGRLRKFLETCHATKEEHALLVDACYPDLTLAAMHDAPEEKRAGILLQRYRTMQGLHVKELAQKIPCNPHTISDWEKGHPIDWRRLPNLKTTLELDPKEYHLLQEACFPALNPEYHWPETVPVAQRAGKLLEALRKIAGEDQVPMAQKTGISKSTLSNLEAGISPIHENFQTAFAGFFKGAEHFNEDTFRKLCDASNQAIEGTHSRHVNKVGSRWKPPGNHERPR